VVRVAGSGAGWRVPVYVRTSSHSVEGRCAQVSFGDRRGPWSQWRRVGAEERIRCRTTLKNTVFSLLLQSCCTVLFIPRKHCSAVP
jgi:hypothetical protein